MQKLRFEPHLIPTLATIAARVATDGHRRLKPSVYLRPTAQPTSQRPAMNRISQAKPEFVTGLLGAGEEGVGRSDGRGDVGIGMGGGNEAGLEG